MSEDGKGYYEIQLDNKWLILVFIGFVVILGLVFVWGMKVGRDTAELERSITGQETVEKSKRGEITEEDLTSSDSSWGKRESGSDLTTYDLATDLITKKKNGKEEKEKPSDTGSSKPKKDKSEEKKSGSSTEKEVKNSLKPDEDLTKKVPSENYIIQILSIQDKAKAEYYVKVLRDEGYPAFLAAFQPPGKNTVLYRVRVGGYPTEEETKSVVSKLLAEEKLSPILGGKKDLLVVKQY